MQWLAQFPSLNTLSDIDKEQLLEKSAVLRVTQDTVIFGPGKKPDHMLLLLDGIVRVQQVSEQGREMVLYRVRAGESCVLTTACLLAYENYSATGLAETDVKAVGIPLKLFDELVASSTAFRRFVFTSYSTRIADLFLVVDEVAFQRIDVRLAERLLELAQGETQLSATHQQLATELGSAREVISRQLAEFQRRGWIELSRGQIQLIDLAGIRSLART